MISSVFLLSFCHLSFVFSQYFFFLIFIYALFRTAFMKLLSPVKITGYYVV